MTDAEYIAALLRRSPHITRVDAVRLQEIAERLKQEDEMECPADPVHTSPPTDGSVFLARVSNKGYQTHTQRFEHTHYTIEALVFDRMIVRYDLDEDKPLFKPYHDQPNVRTTRTIQLEDITTICSVPDALREHSMLVKYWEDDDASED